MRPKFLGQYFALRQVSGMTSHQVLVVYELAGCHQDLRRCTLDPALPEATIPETGTSLGHPVNGGRFNWEKSMIFRQLVSVARCLHSFVPAKENFSSTFGLLCLNSR